MGLSNLDRQLRTEMRSTRKQRAARSVPTLTSIVFGQLGRSDLILVDRVSRFEARYCACLLLLLRSSIFVLAVIHMHYPRGLAIILLHIRNRRRRRLTNRQTDSRLWEHPVPHACVRAVGMDSPSRTLQKRL
jgi:hypothetical protein